MIMSGIMRHVCLLLVFVIFQFFLDHISRAISNSDLAEMGNVAQADQSSYCAPGSHQSNSWSEMCMERNAVRRHPATVRDNDQIMRRRKEKRHLRHCIKEKVCSGFLIQKVLCIRLLLWTAQSPDLSPIENICFLVADKLARHPYQANTVDKLWQRLEVAWNEF
ncbi:hypothetical protein TNCV_1026361 [Trichonephila clavipes]|nr:hypothetical protein TNCV_1026361 [Trichonephila clavipes]